jgi:hypothetical protein
MGGKETLPHLMIQDAIVCLFLLLGSALMLVASIRLVRLPDPLSSHTLSPRPRRWAFRFFLSRFGWLSTMRPPP